MLKYQKKKKRQAFLLTAYGLSLRTKCYAGSFYLVLIFRRIAIGIVGHDLICRGGIKSGVTVDGAIRYRAIFTTVNSACSISVTEYSAIVP